MGVAPTLLGLALSLFATQAHAASIYSVSSSALSALNSSVTGKLYEGVPFSRPCYSVYNGHPVPSDAAACNNMIAHSLDQRFRINSFGSLMNPQWETCQSTEERCLINSFDPSNLGPYATPAECHQGSIAPLYVDIRSESDAVAAFKWAQKYKVSLTIKNTGHDYQGRSSGFETLSLWTHNLQNLTYSPSLTPVGCDASKAAAAITIGAGIHWEKAYQFAEEKKITIVGGVCATVGAAGGWSQGGGHGALSNIYGLGADRLLQFKVVTPDGRVLYANECQNRDLFWALRGGGGGTFGLVLEATHRVAETKPLPLQVYNGTFTPTKELVQQFYTVLVDNSIRWADEGWSGYLSGSTITFMNPLLNATAAAQSIKPVMDLLTSFGTATQINTLSNVSSFYWFEHNYSGPLFELGPGILQQVSGRFIELNNFNTAEARAATVKAFMDVFDKIGFNIFIMVTGPHKYQVPSGVRGDTAVHPAWRTTLWSVLIYELWAWDTPLASTVFLYDRLNQATDYLRTITPGGGSYGNEAHIWEPNWQDSFWGSANYQRLLSIKQKYDPNKILDCWHCVGWQGDTNHRYKCYPPTS